jgi:hypothetical protein
MEAVKFIKHVIGYTPRKVINEEVDFEFVSDFEINISYRGMERSFLRDVNLWYADEPTNEEDVSGKHLFTTEDLMLFPNFQEYNECMGCYGSGHIEVLSYCGRLAGDCCGSCYEWVECECKDRIYPL